MTELRLSPLGHTWILDFDGTLVEHNGYKSGQDRFLPGAREFLAAIPDGDLVIILTAREHDARAVTEAFLQENGVRYDCLMTGVPMGERILLNDTKPSGLKTAFAFGFPRNSGPDLDIVIDPTL
ncbi:MAG: hypothetical protein ACM3Q1_00665 [Bacteroidales bacterium]